MKKVYIVGVFAMVVAALFCASAAPSWAQQKGPIKIGFIAPVTGSFAPSFPGFITMGTSRGYDSDEHGQHHGHGSSGENERDWIKHPFCQSLLHFDGANGSTDFIDETRRLWTSHNGASLDTSQYKFPPSSGHFGWNSDLGLIKYIDSPYQSSDDLHGDFTIEMYIILEELPDPDNDNYVFIVAIQRDDTLAPDIWSFWELQIWNDIVTKYMSDPGGLILSVIIQLAHIYGGYAIELYNHFPADIGVPHHVAIVRHNGIFNLYVDGQPGPWPTYAYDWDGNLVDPVPIVICPFPGRIVIGGNPYYPTFESVFKGWVDEFRLSPGIARYTQAFTPPLAPFDCLTPNQPPVASCQSVTLAAGSHCTANVSIDNGSTDPDGDSITLTQSPAGPYALGSTTVTLTVTDSNGASNQCTGTVTVVDNTPPTISNVSAAPSELWPPNKKMVDVTINYAATDNCGQKTCNINSVTCNESISGSDYTIVDAHHVKLRADRLGSGNGRIYTITITCTDASGNSSSQAVKVTVPHDQGKK